MKLKNFVPSPHSDIRPMISCIIPAFNEEKTIKHVLETVLKVRKLDEIIVINNGSQDDTQQVISSVKRSSKSSRLVALRINKNKGKAAAFVKGLKVSKGNVILMCDADLEKLKIVHIRNIIKTFNEGYDMVIASRIQPTGWWSRLNANISGERIFRKEVVMPWADKITNLGYGIEQALNFLHRDKKTKVIYSKDIGHILKFSKQRWFVAYLKEMIQLVKAEVFIRNKLKDVR